jgi:hypothetical protein
MIVGIGLGNIVSKGVNTIGSAGAIALTFWAQFDCAMAKPSKGIAALPNDLWSDRNRY